MASNQKGEGCIQSFTGRLLYPLNPKVADVDIEDIAHALSNKCRFSGMCRQFYSVAQHCILVSELVERDIAFIGLLHDASEYMLPDVPTPVKPRLKGFKEIEEAVHDAIYKRFGVFALADDPAVKAAVKAADMRAMAIEALTLMPDNPEYWKFGFEPDFDIQIVPMAPAEAKRRFVNRFEQLRANLLTNEETLARVD